MAECIYTDLVKSALLGIIMFTDETADRGQNMQSVAKPVEMRQKRENRWKSRSTEADKEARPIGKQISPRFIGWSAFVE